jgi:hypothetical protein
MKKLMPVLLVVIAFFGCASSALKQQSSDITIEYRALTRGRNVHAMLTHENLKSHSKGRIENAVDKPMPREDWDTLISELEKVDLEKLHALPAPSTKHQYDGAMGATLTVKVADKEYQTVTFDHGNPPAEIEALVTKITKLAEIE